jgi:hypothetical protein
LLVSEAAVLSRYGNCASRRRVGDVETVDDKPADGTVTNGSVTTPKANGDNPVNRPDPDAGDDADSESDGGSGGAES